MYFTPMETYKYILYVTANLSDVTHGCDHFLQATQYPYQGRIKLFGAPRQ